MIIAALAIAGWYVTHLATAFERGVGLDPHGYDPYLVFTIATIVLLVTVPLIGAAGLVLLLLTSATRVETATVANRSLSGADSGHGEGGARALTRSRHFAWEAPQALMGTIATAILLAWALLFLVALLVPFLSWRALPGVALMIELAGLIGVAHLVPHWVFAVVSLIVTLVIVILLYGGPISYRSSNAGKSGSNGELG